MWFQTRIYSYWKWDLKQDSLRGLSLLILNWGNDDADRAPRAFLPFNGLEPEAHGLGAKLKFLRKGGLHGRETCESPTGLMSCWHHLGMYTFFFFELVLVSEVHGPLEHVCEQRGHAQYGCPHSVMPLSQCPMSTEFQGTYDSWELSETQTSTR